MDKMLKKIHNLAVIANADKPGKKTPKHEKTKRIEWAIREGIKLYLAMEIDKWSRMEMEIDKFGADE